MSDLIKDEYLGDGVYASFDGYHIALDLRGQDLATRIALEPFVLDNLVRFRARARKPPAEKVEEESAP